MRAAVSRDVWITAIGPAVWGTTYIATTQLLPPGHPMLDATLRALPAGLAIVLFTRQLPRGRWWGRAFVLGALNIGCYFALLFYAAYRLPGGIAATIGAIAPFAVAFLAWPVLGRRPQRTQLLAALAGLVGVALIVVPKTTVVLDPAGIGAMALATVLMALGTVLTKRWAGDVSPIVLTGWQLLVGGVLLLPVMLAIEPLPAAITVTNAIGFVYIGVVGTALAYLLWFRGIARLSASSVAFMVLISPIVAMLAGRVVLGQTLTLVQVAGAAIVLGAVIAGQRDGRSASPPVAEDVAS